MSKLYTYNYPNPNFLLLLKIITTIIISNYYNNYKKTKQLCNEPGADPGLREESFIIYFFFFFLQLPLSVENNRIFPW